MEFSFETSTVFLRSGADHLSHLVIDGNSKGDIERKRDRQGRRDGIGRIGFGQSEPYGRGSSNIRRTGNDRREDRAAAEIQSGQVSQPGPKKAMQQRQQNAESDQEWP